MGAYVCRVIEVVNRVGAGYRYCLKKKPHASMCLLFYFIVGFIGCRFLFGVFLCYKDVLIWWTLSTGSNII